MLRLRCLFCASFGIPHGSLAAHWPQACCASPAAVACPQMGHIRVTGPGASCMSPAPPSFTLRGPVLFLADCDVSLRLLWPGRRPGGLLWTAHALAFLTSKLQCMRSIQKGCVACGLDVLTQRALGVLSLADQLPENTARITWPTQSPKK